MERIGGVGPVNAARLSQASLTVAGATQDPDAITAAPAKGKKVDAPQCTAKATKAPEAGN